VAQAQIIDGREVANNIREEISEKMGELKSRGITPGLAVVLVGNDPASETYVRMKGRACEKMGIKEKTFTLPESTSQDELLELVSQLNQDKTYHGILVQMPLPEQINPDVIIEALSPEKDVDGLHPTSMGRLVAGKAGFIPCTPHGILKLLEYYDLETDGKHAVVVGRSILVGKPIANLLYQKNATGNATVTICHTHTDDLAQFTRRADILIVAAGAPRAVTADMIKPGAVVIDVGINRVEDTSRERGYRLEGDVDFEKAQKVAGYITPVPGGVGPMTITMLMQNTVWSAERSRG